MRPAICVYCASSECVPRVYFDVADELGARLAAGGYTLVYGGTNAGLMGVLARAVHREGGRVLGVVPEGWQARGIVYEAADEILITRDLHQRKALMDEHADGFIALPGGFGTLDEVFDTLALKLLKVCTKPLAFVNANNYFVGLVEMLERVYAEGFAQNAFREQYEICPDCTSAMAYVAQRVEQRTHLDEQHGLD